MAVGHRLDSFHAACAAKGAEEYCYWARAIHRCLPKRHPHLPLAVSPVCSAATGGRPWHPGLTTAFSSGRSRPTLALSSCAQGAGSDESSAGPAITSRQDDSWPPHSPQYATAHSLMILSPLLCSPLMRNLLSPFVILKKHSRRNVTVTAWPLPHDSLVCHGRFREITLPDTLCELPVSGKFTLLIISGVGGGQP